jgi:outer membrane protein assembly factor BamB
MRKIALHLTQATVLAGLIMLAGAAFGKDWPQWRGPNHDGISKETGLLKTWPQAGPKVLWQAPLGLGYSCVAVADGRVFTQFQKDGAQWAVALDEKTGKELWKIRTGDEYKVMQFDGPRSTPTVDGKRVFVADAQGNLLCLEAATGKTVWQKNILKDFSAQNLQWGVSMSPLIDGNLVLVNGGQSKGASILALNKKDGTLAWKSQDDKGGYASPNVYEIGGQRQAVFFTGEAVVGISPQDGKLLWRHPWATKYDVNAAMPVVKGDHVFVSSGYGSGCALLKIDLKATPPVKEVWKSKVMKAHFNAPILLGDYLYGFDEAALVCVNFMTGKKMWEQAGLSKGAIFYADGLAYIVGEKGNLVLGKVSPEKFEKLAEVNGLISGPRAWTMPVVANGRLYLRDEAKLVCLDVKAK